MDEQARARARKAEEGFAGGRLSGSSGVEEYLRNASMASGMESNFDSSIVEEGIAAAGVWRGRNGSLWEVRRGRGESARRRGGG